MPRWQFWKPAEPTPRQSEAAQGETAAARTDSPSSTPVIGSTSQVVMSPERRQRRIEDLRRRRAGLIFDIEQGELAQSSENPWQERIALLQESIATITADRSRLDDLPPEPTWPVPALPVSGITVSTAEQAEVWFAVGDHAFAYVEAADWDNRGGMVVRGDLRRVAGNPVDIPTGGSAQGPPEGWLPVLDSALTAFALGLRDTALDGGERPSTLTLRDIIREDNAFGGWLNVHGTSNVRVQRAWQRQELRAEEDRLARELTHEQEERRTLIDRLPVARKRLSVLDEDLRALGASPTR